MFILRHMCLLIYAAVCVYIYIYIYMYMYMYIKSCRKSENLKPATVIRVAVAYDM